MKVSAPTERAISVESRADGKYLFVTLQGKVAAADYEYFVPHVEDCMKHNDAVNMLVRLVDFHGWTAGALWEDTKFALAHFGDINRLAIVGDSKWEKGMAAFCKPFTSAEVRYFDESDYGEAGRWIVGDAGDEGH